MCNPVCRNIFRQCLYRFFNPWCWIVVFPALAAILGAPSYLWAASRWQQFGVATLFALVLAVVLLAMGEIDITQSLLIVAVVRQIIGNRQKQGILLAYPVLPLGIIVWLMKLWTNSEWYYQGAAEEIGADYAEGLKTLSSLWALFGVVALTFVVGFIGIRIAATKMKSSDRLC